MRPVHGRAPDASGAAELGPSRTVRAPQLDERRRSEIPLLQDRGGAAVMGVRRKVAAAPRGHEEHHDIRARGAHPSGRLDTVDALHADVEQHEVRSERGVQLDRLGPAPRHAGKLEPGSAPNDFGCGAQILLAVVDHQYARPLVRRLRHRSLSSSAAGSGPRSDRKRRLATTRLLTSTSSGRSSFWKIELMFFSTARFVRKSDSAIAAFDLPSATPASTSRSRVVRCKRRELRARDFASTSTSTTFGSTTLPPSATARIAPIRWLRWPIRSFSRYARRAEPSSKSLIA